MATGNYKMTFASVSTGVWGYPDVMGNVHYVNSGQTCTMTSTDEGTTGAYNILTNQALTTADGHKLYFRPQSDVNNVALQMGSGVDTTAVKNMRGEMIIECPVTGIQQRWRPTSFQVNDADAPAAINASWEDQYGNIFHWSSLAVATTSSS